MDLTSALKFYINNMVWSKYNLLFKSDTDYLLYNSLSNSFAELDKATYQVLCELSDSGNIANLDGALAEDLIKIKALVDSDELEIKRIKHLTLCHRFANNSLHLTINPTLNCNFACPYCFEKTQEHSKIMDEETENKVAEFIKKADKKIVNVVWFGGEPLLGFKSIERLTQKIIDLGVIYNATMVTNGYLLSETVISKLAELKINSLQITLDGNPEIHNSRRKLKNGGKTFDVILSNVKKVYELSPDTRVNIRVNLDRTNIDSYIGLYDTIRKLNCSNITTYPAFVNDSTEDARNACICDDADQFSFVIELYKKTGIQALPFYPLPNKSECSIRNRNSIVIGPNGELYKCWQDVGVKDKIYGYIDGQVSNEKVLLEYLMDADPLDDEECRECLLFPICSGGCPYARIKAQKNPDFSKPCPLYKTNLVDFLKLHYENKKKCR